MGWGENGMDVLVLVDENDGFVGDISVGVEVFV